MRRTVPANALGFSMKLGVRRLVKLSFLVRTTDGHGHRHAPISEVAMTLGWFDWLHVRSKQLDALGVLREVRTIVPLSIH